MIEWFRKKTLLTQLAMIWLFLVLIALLIIFPVVTSLVVVYLITFAALVRITADILGNE